MLYGDTLIQNTLSGIFSSESSENKENPQGTNACLWLFV